MKHRPSDQEKQHMQAFYAAHLKAGVLPPFSFTYGGVPCSELLPGWRFEHETRPLDGTATEHVATYTDPQTSLQVRCAYVVFTDYPAVEWVVTFKNGGRGDTSLLEGVQALDVELSGEDWTLHRALGSSASRSDFAPVEELLPLDADIHLAPVGGRSSNTTALPFFNLQARGKGVMVGIGWSGQWAAELHRPASASVWVRAGMERTRIKLQAGQEIRTPRILLLFWDGDDRMRGHNLFRRFILDHHTPRRNGQPVAGPLACNGGPKMLQESNLATGHNQIALAERYRQFGLDTEYYWIDAGWFDGRWPNGVGNWTIRKDGFPDGLRPVSDALKEMGFGLILWFEPERVYRDTWLDREHPDWVLRLPGNPNGLLDLGGEKRTLTGAELGSGLDVTIAEARGSLLATYCRCPDP